MVIILRGELERLAAMQFSTGDLTIFAGMCSFALFSTWLRSLPSDLNRLGLLGAQLAIAVVALFPFLVGEYISGARPNWNATAFAAMLHVGVAASLLANLFYMFGVARVGPAKAGMFILLVPLYGAFMSVIFLGESLHLYHATGMAAIIAGLICARVGDSAVVTQRAPLR